MKRPDAAAMARELRRRGIAPEWRITISETMRDSQPTGNWRVVISTEDGEQAMAIYQCRILQQGVALPPVERVS